MIGNRIFYVSTSKKALESKDWETFIDEAVCEDLPHGVELVDEFYDNFEPEMIEGNDFFNIKKDDDFFELTLKEDAIEKALALYSKTLRDFADYIDKEKTRGMNPIKGIAEAGAYFKHQEIFDPFGVQRFVVVEEYNDLDWVDITSIETIYGLVDFAIMQGIDKWYLHPQVGYYRFKKGEEKNDRIYKVFTVKA